ncbi:MAG: putative zinc-binding protein [Saccharospirillum sp.]|nr:putative zinc-binding protein [Saccharospirillum sp.]
MSTNKESSTEEALPLVYSCSGCSNVAQLTNDIAVALNRDGVAEMSCIAGLGGDVKPLVKKAKSGRKILCLDGCSLRCALNTLARHDISPDYYIQLDELQIKKRYNEGCTLKESYQAMCHVYEILGKTPPHHQLIGTRK